MDEYLWPARNVAEYAYCPRLFYLMEVEGLHIPSADTEKGNAVHKRVDRPSNEPTDDDPEKPKTIRSLTLTDHSIGLTATLDLAELSGECATPIEYRKGRPQRNRIELPDENMDDEEARYEFLPWPTDRVQIGLQMILLRSSGYDVRSGLLYYAEEKRKVPVVFDETLKSEALDFLARARECSQGERPKPLVCDPRCPKCSMQPICLPDEINYQSDPKPNDEMTPRRIWPPRDDGIHVVAQTDGVKIGVRGEMVRVVNSEGKTVKEIPLVNVESLSILGALQISTQALHSLAEKGIPISFLSSAGRLVAMVDPLDSVSAKVRSAQVREFDKPERSLALVHALVVSKINNQRTMLMRNCLSVAKTDLDAMSKLAGQALSSSTIDETRGLEGMAAAIYFRNFSGMIKGSLGDEFETNGRQRRPPPDPVNSCLSMAYTMLCHDCVAALRTARLEPSIGAFHVSRPGRPALALDLMEPFRPLIADSLAVTMFNKGELGEGHFRRTAAGCVLSDAGRRAFFEAYGRRMETDITHPVFGYRLSYRRMIILHARMIAAWLVGDTDSLAFLTTR